MVIRLARWSIAVHLHKGFFRLPSETDFNRTNLFMFAQDIPLRTAPYSRRFDGEDQPTFRLQGNVDDVEKAVACLGEIGPDRNLDPEEVAEGAVRHVVQRLVWFGRLLVDLRNERVRMDGGVYHSAECYDSWTPHVGAHVLQFGFVRERNRFVLHIGRVPRDNVFVSSIPRELGGVRGFRAMTRWLDRFNPTGPRHWQTALLAGTLQTGDWNFDFTSYRRRVSAYRDWLTRAWGWDGRDTSVTLKTEYYGVYRFLRMQRACAILRVSILQALQGLFQARGSRARVVTPLPTAEQIDEIIERLARGDISMEAAYKLVGIA